MLEARFAVGVNMLRKFCITILCAITLMAVASPGLQCDSLDSFPVSSDDIESLVTFCFCLAGMVVLFAYLFNRVPVMLQAFQFVPRHGTSTIPARFDELAGSVAVMSSPPPLRI
jgi:hypothetical protein